MALSTLGFSVEQVREGKLALEPGGCMNQAQINPEAPQWRLTLMSRFGPESESPKSLQIENANLGCVFFETRGAPMMFLFHGQKNGE